MDVFRSHGKLLLTAEYLVLDGAKALAMPTKKGQTLKVEQSTSNGYTWNSIDHENNNWFRCELDADLNIKTSSDTAIAKTLQNILREAKKLNATVFKTDGLNLTTYLDFDRSWGLGSSSTLINNIASWAKVEPYKLLWNSFSGSGYDIACASAKNPIFYKLENKKTLAEDALFNPTFKDSLYFIHLNQKQDSREGIKRYRTHKKEHLPIHEINKIGEQFCTASSLKDFQELITQHETIISKIIDLTPVKQQLFKDYDGAIKSLGAWGGDFVLAAGNNTETYFKEKGFHTVIQFTDMIL